MCRGTGGSKNYKMVRLQDLKVNTVPNFQTSRAPKVSRLQRSKPHKLPRSRSARFHDAKFGWFVFCKFAGSMVRQSANLKTLMNRRQKRQTICGKEPGNLKRGGQTCVCRNLSRFLGRYLGLNASQPRWKLKSSLFGGVSFSACLNS